MYTGMVHTVDEQRAMKDQTRGFKRTILVVCSRNLYDDVDLPVPVSPEFRLVVAGILNSY